MKQRKEILLIRIEYIVSGIEDYVYPTESFDFVISSLALHYIEDLNPVFANIHRTLKPEGNFVFTIEHPVFTAQGSQEWMCDDKGTPLYWPVDNYYIEGRRVTNFLGENIVKYHHTLTSIVQSLLKNGFTIENLIEPQPTKEMLETIPGMKDEMRRPMLLAVSVSK